MAKEFEVMISRNQTKSFRVTAKNKDDAIDKALDMAYNMDWAEEEADYETIDVASLASIQRKKDIAIGDNIYDCDAGEFCTVLGIVNNNGEKEYEVRGNKSSSKIETWKVKDANAYQIVPDRLCHNGHILCYEHNTDIDYPYYCPFCDENMYEIETIKTRF